MLAKPLDSIGSQSNTSAQLNNSSNATNSSAVAVEAISFSIRIKNTTPVTDAASTTTKGRLFPSFARFKVNALESVLMGTNANRTNDEKVTVRARVNKASKFTSGFTNTALNSDAKVPLITGDKKEAA